MNERAIRVDPDSAVAAANADADANAGADVGDGCAHEDANLGRRGTERPQELTIERGQIHEPTTRMGAGSPPGYEDEYKRPTRSGRT